MKPTSYPDQIRSVSELESMLSDPPAHSVETMQQLEGDLMILGAGGKMGPTLAMLAKSAATQAGRSTTIYGVSRFSDSAVKQRLEDHGVKTISGDLMDRKFIDQLPEVRNIIYFVGMKFGSTENEPLMWAYNTWLPGMVCERFSSSRIVALSTGNVYGMTSIDSGGSLETDVPHPDGEYAQSALGRERIFQHFSQTLNIPISIVRLNYANELRYGVLVDLALRIKQDLPIDLNMGAVNVIWQSDANAMILSATQLASTPASVLNVAGPECLKVRSIVSKMAKIMGRNCRFEGEESSDAFLNNASKSHTLFGSPRVDADQLAAWIAHWIKDDGETLNKPTHFQVRSGSF